MIDWGLGHYEHTARELEPVAQRVVSLAELVRVVRPGGRALVSAWVPAGPIDAMVGVFGRALAKATGRVTKRFAWHDVRAVSELAANHGARILVHEGELEISAESPEAYFEANEQQHPMSVAGRPVLEQAGAYADVRKRVLEALRQGNRDPHGFRVSSPYRVIEISLSG
jgi:SAM-dependent methyltransferase